MNMNQVIHITWLLHIHWDDYNFFWKRKISVGKEAEKLELLYLAGGSGKWHVALEDSLAVPQSV